VYLAPPQRLRGVLFWGKGVLLGGIGRRASRGYGIPLGRLLAYLFIHFERTSREAINKPFLRRKEPLSQRGKEAIPKDIRATASHLQGNQFVRKWCIRKYSLPLQRRRHKGVAHILPTDTPPEAMIQTDLLQSLILLILGKFYPLLDSHSVEAGETQQATQQLAHTPSSASRVAYSYL